jgi:hypothetical protein
MTFDTAKSCVSTTLSGGNTQIDNLYPLIVMDTTHSFIA